MKKFGLLIIGLFILICSNPADCFGAEKPVIQFKKKIHDFGKVKQGAPLEYVFVFKNTGDGILKIKGIESSCGCTAVKTEAVTEYKKNQTGKITARYSTRGKNGKDEQYVIVYTNDPENPEIYLTIRCEVSP